MPNNVYAAINVAADTIEPKSGFKQFFCKHRFVKARKKSLFQHIGGERIYIICEKCGKIDRSYFDALP